MINFERYFLTQDNIIPNELTIKTIIQLKLVDKNTLVAISYLQKALLTYAKGRQVILLIR